MKCGGSGSVEKIAHQVKSCSLSPNIDYVMHGNRPTAMPSDVLSAEEQELLALFRQASELGRAVIMSAARGAEKKEAASAADQVA